MFAKLWCERGPEDEPYIVAGDMNFFAPRWKQIADDGFEIKCEATGFESVYTAL